MKKIVLLLITISMSAQQLPKHIDLPELGLSFDLPEGWNGQVDGEYIVLGHNSIPGLMILSENASNDANELKQLAEQGITAEGVQLNAVDMFSIKDTNRVEGMYTGLFNGTNVKCYAIGLINNLGKGLNILILTETDKFTEAHIKEARTLASSVKFFEVKDSEVTSFWKDKLVGKQLYFGLTRGDGSEKRSIDLCSDGSFSYYSNTHIAFDEDYGYGTANSNKNKTGSYKIYSIGAITILELSFNDGEVYEYDLTTNENDNTFLDAARYYVRDSEYCS